MFNINKDVKAQELFQKLNDQVQHSKLKSQQDFKDAILDQIKLGGEQFIDVQSLSELNFDCISLNLMLNKSYQLSSLGLQIFYYSHSAKDSYLNYLQNFQVLSEEHDIIKYRNSVQLRDEINEYFFDVKVLAAKQQEFITKVSECAEILNGYLSCSLANQIQLTENSTIIDFFFEKQQDVRYQPRFLQFAFARRQRGAPECLSA